MRRLLPNGATVGGLLPTVVVTVPLLVVFSSWLQPKDRAWDHIAQDLLGTYVGNSLLLALTAGGCCLVLGTTLAWFSAACEFPGRRFFDWAAILPFAFPTYVIGFVLIGALDYAGPVQTFLRDATGDQLKWFPQVRGFGGLIVAMTLALYPYVYLLARGAFLQRGKRALEVAQSFGYGPWKAFFVAALPAARPWIAGGLLLTLMEILADFGTVSVFNVGTFTTGIYKAWFGFFSMNAAAQLASLLVLFSVLLLAFEKRYQSKRRYYPVVGAERSFGRMALGGWRAWSVTGLFSGVLAAGFVLPLIWLIHGAAASFEVEIEAGYGTYVMRTIWTGVAGTVLIVMVTTGLVYAKRLSPGAWMNIAVLVAGVGYALPGTVLAIGVYKPVAWLENFLADVGLLWRGEAFDVYLTGTVAVMLIAYLVRFMGVAFQPLESGMGRITKAMESASRALGYGRGATLWHLHLPLMRPAILTALTLVFVEILKEMPITLMTKPFGWSTLSVRIFELTSEGEYQRAALPSLLLVLVGLIPVILLTRMSDGKKPGKELPPA